MIPIIISGAKGRMGAALISCALESGDFEIAGAVEAPGHPDIGCTLSGHDRPGIILADHIQKDAIGKGAVLIEFTSPEATMINLEQAEKAAIPVVIGTTGLKPAQEACIREAARSIPVCYASNMSIGMNLLFQVVRRAAEILGADYDIEIFETHHRFKKDAPSGSARTLAEAAAAGLGVAPGEAVIHGRSGMVGDRPRGQIGVHALRAGDVVGEHTVMFGTLGERLELTHRCHNRSTFARGALRAAQFIYRREPGLVDMRDVLGLR